MTEAWCRPGAWYGFRQALKSLAGGLELRHPDPKLLEDLDSR